MTKHEQTLRKLKLIEMKFTARDTPRKAPPKLGPITKRVHSATLKASILILHLPLSFLTFA